MKNTYCLFFLVILISSSAYSQGFFNKEQVQNNRNYLEQRRWSWGYYLGFNNLDFKIDRIEESDEIAVTKNVGFNVGLIGNFKLNNYIDLRLEPGVIFSTRDLDFTKFGDDQVAAFRETNAAYVYVPFVVKFSTKRLNNFKPFVTTGIGIAHNLSSNEDNPDDNSAGQFRMKTTNFMYEVGFGIDFYLEYFKFTPSIKGVFGLNDELIEDKDPNSPWTGNLDKIATRGIFINFTFQ
ncbi:type IX secretion/gliding motility protein PorT/SprT [Flavobacteriaceae bacterium 14752]|uniref:type IX secretion/gliding motility protein PorT/SprT n=1 Tax=Mesohalobacter salilacus TaxID=2491711 RepID=UPI000F62D422|nr:PorT family protein [Flavobacteriaceae bacterium 14752]